MMAILPHGACLRAEEACRVSSSDGRQDFDVAARGAADLRASQRSIRQSPAAHISRTSSRSRLHPAPEARWPFCHAPGRWRRQAQPDARPDAGAGGAVRRARRRPPCGPGSSRRPGRPAPSSSASACDDSSTIAPSSAQLAHDLVEALAQRRVEAGGRLVQQQQRAGGRAAPARGRAAGACPWNRCRPGDAPPRRGRPAPAAPHCRATGWRFSRA